MSKILFGVHNKHYNLDFYDDMSINIYDHIACETVTDFDEETVALFVAFLKRDGHLDHLLKLGFGAECEHHPEEKVLGAISLEPICNQCIREGKS